MASVSSVGIGSGVLTSDLIDQLVEAERAPTELRLDRREEDITTELSVFGQIQSAITDLRLASRPLASPDLFQSLNLSSSNSAVSGSATSAATEGTYSLEVSNLASSQSLSTGIFADTDSTEVGTGSLAITIGTTTTNIAIDASNNTLDGIAAAINNESGLAATASVINVGNGFRLVIASDNTGSNSALDIAVTDTGDANNTDAVGLSQLSFTTGAQNLTENQAASDAAFTINGIAITRSTNDVSDVVEGLSFQLNSTNVGSPAQIVVSRDVSSITENVQEFVDAYNAVQSLIEENTNFNPDNPAANGVLLGDSATRTITNQFRSILGSTVLGLESSNVRSLAEVGISTNQEDGSLNFDANVFETQLAANPQDIAALFSDQGRATDAQVEFVRAGTNTVPGTYAINVTQAAERASETGTVSLGASTVIDADNDTLTLSVDGTASGTITLTAGTYTQEELATELQTQINADSALLAAGRSVQVSVDGSNQLVISSAQYGSSASVAINSVDTDTVAELGLEQGIYRGSVALGASTVIDTNNNTLTVSVDGTSSGEITLTSGTYTAAQLATEIETQINADANLSGAGLSVAVSLSATDELVITSNGTGANRGVNISFVDQDSQAELGLFAGAGTIGVDVAGTINGVAATGDGQTLIGATGDPSEGIRVNILGSLTGDRGSITYIEGVGERFVDLINSFLGSNGTITAKNQRLNAQLDLIAEERVSLNERVATLNEQLVRQFTAADILISQLNSTQDFISAQLDAITGANNQDN